MYIFKGQILCNTVFSRLKKLNYIGGMLFTLLYCFDALMYTYSKIILFFSVTTCKSDQFDCKEAGCANPDWTCEGTCIFKGWVNNGKEDCADGSDEGAISKYMIYLDRVHYVAYSP